MNVEPAIDKRRGYRLWRAAAIILPMALLLAMGWWAGETSARRTDVEMRERLLRQATELAASIDPEWACQLTFTAADKNSPVYELIRNQMTSLARIMPLHGIYSMRQHAGTIFFGPEDYPVDDPMASPPGTEYKRPSAELLGAFRKRSAITVGPVTDEYGTFISAAAPVLDPQNGQVLMMVGMDILAGEWRSRVHAARREPWLATLMLMLVFSVSLIAARRRLRRAPPGALQLRSWIVAPTALAILFGLLLYGAREIHDFNRTTSRNMQQVLLQAQSQWNQNMVRQARIMGRRIEEIKAAPGLKQAWLARDLPTLTALAQPVLAALKRECGVTHLTFVAPDRTVFLRAHKPDRRGDRLDRCAILAAERTGYDFWGVELDSMGMLGLRYVRPWQENARTIGYLELGLEINRPVQQLAADMRVDVAALIHKKPAARQAFEQGRERFGFVTPWDTYADMAVTHQTMAMLPGAVTRWINKHGGQANREGEVFTARQDAARFACGVLELPTSMGRETLELLIIRNITPEFQTAWSALFLHLGLAIALFGGILALIWTITSRAERQLKSSFAAMQASEARYHMLFDTMADGIVHVTPDGRIVQANAAAERIIGLKRSEIERLNCNGPEWNGIRPDGTPRPYEERALQRALKERRTVRDVEMGVRRADGTYLWINSNAAPIINAAGELEGVVASFTDLTARKEAESLLQLQRDLAVAVLAQDSLDGALQQLLEMVCRIPGVDSGGVYRVDGTTGRAELLAHRGLSDAFVAEIAHVEPDNFRARLLLEGLPIYINGDARPSADVDGVLAMEGLRTLAIIPQHFNGRVVAALNLGSHTCDRFSPATSTMIESIAAQMGGLIARLDAQNAVRQVRQNLETLFETMTDILFILDEAGRVVHANRAANETLGYAAEQLARLTVLDLHPPDRREEVAAIVADMLAGRCQTCLVPLVDRSGRLIEVETKVHVGQWDGRMALFGISRDISERVRAGKEIFRAKEDWERTFASVPDLIALLDSDHRITRVNQALAERLGCMPEQAVGRYCYEVIHGLSAPPACCPHARMLVSRKQEHTELEEAGLGGFFDVTVTPLRNASGAFIGSVHVAHDITDRKKAEQSLREKEMALSKAQQIAHVGSWELVDATHELRWSDETFRMFGYAPRAVAPTIELFMQCIHPDDRAQMQAAVTAAWDARTPFSEEHRIVRPDGEERIVHERAEVLFNDAGQPIKWMGTVQDITERKRVEQALMESEASFRNLAENTWYGMVVSRADEQIVFGNRRACELLGYSPKALLRIKTGDAVMPADYPMLRQRLQQRLEGRTVGKYEVCLRRGDGTKFPAEIAGTRTIWQGEMCALFLFQDLTERKRLENEILQVSDWEKTRIGQDLHDTLGQQLAGVTYLSQALGSAWKSQPPAETEKTLAQLAVESQRAVELVRQVARGLTPVAQRPGGLADALCGMAERMRQIHGVNCVFEAAAKVEIADRQMASHLFFLAQEAVTNAARHGQARHIVVRLSQTDDSQAELSIQDNGVGLPVDRPAGSGLGLRIMQYRADLINGTLAIERVESGGTRVVCRFTTGGG
jgi:PAS domain S-box-containing protein